MSCGHRCTKDCHSGPCSAPQNCKKKVVIRCPCKRQKKDFSCHLVGAGKATLECDDVCALKLKEKEKVCCFKFSKFQVFRILFSQTTNIGSIKLWLSCHFLNQQNSFKGIFLYKLCTSRFFSLASPSIHAQYSVHHHLIYSFVLFIYLMPFFHL